jgi:AraC family transcriptional regulator
MNYRACIQESLDYIEDHLKDDLTAETLARIAGFSPYHYYRVFQAYVGKPVMEYIRCRRLAYAVVELAQGRRILDIALDYGFETHNGFSKAFRKLYGCSPETYRLHGTEQVPAKVDLFLFAQYQLKGTWKYIHEVWFPISSYEFAEGKADFEFYPCTDPVEKVKIYVPVTKK